MYVRISPPYFYSLFDFSRPISANSRCIRPPFPTRSISIYIRIAKTLASDVYVYVPLQAQKVGKVSPIIYFTFIYIHAPWSLNRLDPHVSRRSQNLRARFDTFRTFATFFLDGYWKFKRATSVVNWLAYVYIELGGRTHRRPLSAKSASFPLAALTIWSPLAASPSCELNADGCRLYFPK